MKRAIPRQITEGNIWKQILLFFFPILMGSFFQQMYNTVDTIIVGRFVGTTALAAVGSTGSLVGLINGFFTGIGSGATVVLSQFYGAENKEGIQKSLHTGVCLAVVLGCAVTTVGCLFAPEVLRWMQMPAECLPIASVYIRIYFAGAVASMLYNMGAGILRAMGDSRRPMVFLVICCFVNIFGDVLFVVVLGMGVAGAAIATVLAQVISAILSVFVLMRLPEHGLKVEKLKLDSTLLKRILGIGVPAGLQFVTFDLSNILIQAGVNSFGDVTMAAWTALCKTDTLTWMISGAFGVAITTFVGQNFGAQKYSRVRRSVWVCMVMSVAMVGSLSILEYHFREFILGIYTVDPGVIQTGSYVMSIIVPFNALFMPVEILAGAMRGTGYSVAPTVITGVFICAFRVIWLATVVRRWHVLGMLAVCYPVSWLLASAVFLGVYLKGDWLRKRIAQCGLEPERRD